MSVWILKIQVKTLTLFVLFLSCQLGKAELRTLQKKDFPQTAVHSRPSFPLRKHVDASQQNQKDFDIFLHPSSSNVYKIFIHHRNHLNDSQNYAKTGALNLHKIIHRLKHYTRGRNLQFYNAPQNHSSPSNITENKTVGNFYIRPSKISVNLPSFITNNTRLKRQLEGIFHVRGATPTTTTTSISETSTAIPSILPSVKYRATPPRLLTTSLPLYKKYRQQTGNAGQPHKSNNFGTIYGSDDKSKTTEKETSSSSSEENSNDNASEGGNEDAENPNGKIATVPNLNFFNSKKLPTSTENNEDELNIIPDLHDNINNNGKRNFSVEIVETVRKTVIKQDNNDNDNKNVRRPFASTLLKPVAHFTSTPVPHPPILLSGRKIVDSKESLQRQNFFKPLAFSPPSPSPEESPPPASGGIRPFRPRLKLRFPKPQIVDDSATKASQQNQQSKRNLDTVNTIPTDNQESKEQQRSSEESNGEQQNPQQNFQQNVKQNNNIRKKILVKKPKPTEVRVNVQEQIPYNDREVDEADLKDYFDGQSTFGAKGDFKHTVVKNATNFVPNPQYNPPPNYNNPPKNNNPQYNPPKSISPKYIPRKTNTKVKHDHPNPRKRTFSGQTKQPRPEPVEPSIPLQFRRSRSRGANANSVPVEQAVVKERNDNPKKAIYTATGKTINIGDAEEKEEEEEKAKTFQYSGNREKNDNFPKLLKSTLDELYRQGHPAVAKPPAERSFKNVYGSTNEEDFHHENPFKANPLVDDVPLKFDPESDRFYGEPVPDRHKDRDGRLAQSNRPEPVRIENQRQKPPTADYQNNSPTTPTRDRDDDDRKLDKRVGKAAEESEKDEPANDKDEPEPKDDRDDTRNEKDEPRNDRDEPTNDRDDPREKDYRDDGRDDRSNDRDDDNVDYDREPGRRAYPPPNDYDDYGNEDPAEGVIKDFVSLDNNFQPLPRPSSEEESFRSLVPEEADDDESSRYFEPGGRRGRSRDRDERDDEEDEPTSTRDSGRRSRSRDDDDYRAPEDDYRAPYDDDETAFAQPKEFDAAYVDALKAFDDEINKIQRSERDGSTTGNPPSSTGEPLVITSPGPTVSYNRRNAEEPSHGTTPVQPHPQEDEQEEEEEETDDRNSPPPRRQREEQEEQDDRRSPPRGKADEEEEEAEDESAPVTSSSKEEQPRSGRRSKPKDGDEIIKINKVVKDVKGKGKQKEGKQGNIDEDITNIDREFGLG